MLTSQQLYQQARQLPALEKLRLAESLLADLDLPDSNCDKVWANEAQNRYQAQKMQAVMVSDESPSVPLF